MWGGASGHTYTLARRPDGRTDIDAIVVRDGKKRQEPEGTDAGGRAWVFGKSILGKELAKSAKAIEVRNGKAT